MSRPLRLEFEGALYHVTSRGDRRESIVGDDTDRQTWLAVLEQGLERFAATAFAYCLMSNHYHVVLQTHRPNLSRLMRHVNGVYTQTYNRRHGVVGHLFQGRFKAILVEEESYFLEVCRYVGLNPVRANMVKRPQDWAWSSYRARTGRGTGRARSGALHRRLAPRAPRRDGPQRYAEFVAQGREVRLGDQALTGQIYLGGEAFVKRMQARAELLDATDIPRAQRRAHSHTLQWYLDRYDRDTAIARAHLEGGHTQSMIARATDLSVPRVNRLVAAHEARATKDKM